MKEKETSAQPEKKTVMFQTPSPVGSNPTSTQEGETGASGHSLSEEEIPFTLLPNPPAPPSHLDRKVKAWSPPPQPETILQRPKVSVEQLDMSVPPPSLHSNYRPPALNSPPPPQSQAPVLAPGRQSSQALQGIQPIRSALPTFDPLALGGLSLTESLYSQETSVWSQPPEQHVPPGLPHSNHNPISELLSSVERPATLPGLGYWPALSPGPPSTPGAGSSGLGAPSYSGTGGPTYSLFSSPGAGGSLGWGGAGHILNQHQNTSQMSPLERLIGQARPDQGFDK